MGPGDEPTPGPDLDVKGLLPLPYPSLYYLLPPQHQAEHAWMGSFPVTRTAGVGQRRITSYIPRASQRRHYPRNDHGVILIIHKYIAMQGF